MQPIELSNGGQMNAGTIKIGKSGEIIFQFKNYHHIIDGDTELCYAHMVERKINELNQALQKANEENERLKKSMSADVFKIEDSTNEELELPEIEPGPITIENKIDLEKLKDPQACFNCINHKCKIYLGNDSFAICQNLKEAE